MKKELEDSGFRLVEIDESPAERATSKTRRPPSGGFRWSVKPNIGVRVRAEPDPDAVLPEPEESFLPQETFDSEDEDDEDIDTSMDIPEGSGLLPLGIATALNKAVAEENKGKKVQRHKKMKGETSERP